MIRQLTALNAKQTQENHILKKCITLFIFQIIFYLKAFCNEIKRVLKQWSLFLCNLKQVRALVFTFFLYNNEIILQIKLLKVGLRS